MPTVRPIQTNDDDDMAEVIRVVMTEHGADGPGFAMVDAEVQAMSEAYRGPKAGYFVIELDGNVLGGGGFAQLEGGEASVCELRKMYFRKEVRGIGAGANLLKFILDRARAASFKTCYLETIDNMVAARRLYEGFGFSRLQKQWGQTGHFSCHYWYALDLASLTPKL